MKVKVAQSYPTLCDLMNYTPWNSPGQNAGVGSLSLLQGSFQPTQGSNPGIKPRSPTLQAVSLPAERQRKPKNTGVGSLLLHQQIFLTQESNLGLLHCRQIFYQLSYQGSISIIHHCLLPPHSLQANTYLELQYVQEKLYNYLIDFIWVLVFHQNTELDGILNSITAWFSHRNFLYWLLPENKSVPFAFLVVSRNSSCRKQLSGVPKPKT